MYPYVSDGAVKACSDPNSLELLAHARFGWSSIFRWAWLLEKKGDRHAASLMSAFNKSISLAGFENKISRLINFKEMVGFTASYKYVKEKWVQIIHKVHALIREKNVVHNV